MWAPGEKALSSLATMEWRDQQKNSGAIFTFVKCNNIVSYATLATPTLLSLINVLRPTASRESYAHYRYESESIHQYSRIVPPPSPTTNINATTKKSIPIYFHAP